MNFVFLARIKYTDLRCLRYLQNLVYFKETID